MVKGLFQKLFSASVSFLPWLILLAGLAISMTSISLIEVIQLKVFDQYQKTWPRTDNEFPVYVIDIDEKSLSEIGQWPWPRTVLAELVKTSFETYSLSGMAFDMVFAEPDRTSPEFVSQNWPLSKSEKSTIQSLPEHDDVFAKTIQNYNVVAGIAFNFEEQTRNNDDMMPRVSLSGVSSYGEWLSSAENVTRNISEIEESSHGLAHFNMVPEVDSIVRSVPAFIEFKGHAYPSLSIELLRVAMDQKSYIAFAEENAGLTGFRLGRTPIIIPVDKGGRIWTRFKHYSRDQYISASDILNKRLPEGYFDNGLAFLGTSAPGLFDLRSSPLDAVVPGVDIHKQTLETILSGEFLQRPWWSEMFPTVFTLISGILLIVLVNRFGSIWAGIVAVSMLFTSISVSVIAFKNYGYLIDATVPTATLVFMFMMQNFIKYAREEASKKQIRNAFSHYLSPELVTKLSESSDGLQLGGEQKNMTILFSDIRSFTSISEKLTPEELSGLLNDYLTPMTEIIMNSEGTIDKYMGDAIMAFWNAPLDTPNHAYLSCKSARDMELRLEELNVELTERGLPNLAVGIGINTGMCSVGNMGSKQRFDYTVMGDSVNLASRLEGQSKQYGVITIASSFTKDVVPEAEFLFLDLVAVKGKTEPVALYELIGIDETVSDDLLHDQKAAADGFKAYQNREWAKAEKLYKSLKVHNTLKELFLDRIKAYKKTPPAKDWNGAFISQTK